MRQHERAFEQLLCESYLSVTRMVSAYRMASLVTGEMTPNCVALEHRITPRNLSAITMQSDLQMHVILLASSHGLIAFDQYP